MVIKTWSVFGPAVSTSPTHSMISAMVSHSLSIVGVYRIQTEHLHQNLEVSSLSIRMQLSIEHNPISPCLAGLHVRLRSSLSFASISNASADGSDSTLHMIHS